MNNEKKSKVKILFEPGNTLAGIEGTQDTKGIEGNPKRVFRIVFEKPDELPPEPAKKSSVKIVFSNDEDQDIARKIVERNDKKEQKGEVIPVPFPIPKEKEGGKEGGKREQEKDKWAWVSTIWDDRQPSVSTIWDDRQPSVSINDPLNIRNDRSEADNSENIVKKSSFGTFGSESTEGNERPDKIIERFDKNTLLLEGETDEIRDREIAYPVTSGVILAEEYRKGSNRTPQVDPTGFWASEKYDGIRVLWDGISLWTRAMNQINAPIWFQARLPPSFSLDGELFIKRDHFNETSGIIRNKVPNPDDWAPMKFMVFDIPHLGTMYPFEKRLEILKEIVHRYGEPLTYINHIKIKSSSHLDSIHLDLMSKGAEGTMIRAPNSYYESGRSRSLLKVKDQYDAECLVEGWEEGKNRNEGRLGALEVTWEDPVGVWEKYGNEYDTPYHGTFKAGSGLSAVDRVLMKDAQKVFPRGTRVKVAFSQLQKSGKPKHPAYKGRV